MMASIMSSGCVVNGCAVNGICAVNGCAVNYADDAAYIEGLEALDDIVYYALYDAEFDLTEDSIRFLDKKNKKKGVEKKKKLPITNQEKDMNQLVKKFKKRLTEEKKRHESKYFRNKRDAKADDSSNSSKSSNSSSSNSSSNSEDEDEFLVKPSYYERLEKEFFGGIDVLVWNNWTDKTRQQMWQDMLVLCQRGKGVAPL
jgi:hypothetical protein